MTVREAPCPACGGPVRFRISSSLVTICPFCHSVVARGDKRLEDLGKVADLAETGSPLRLDLRGKYQGKPFRLVGRAQYRHAAGGLWDEWYAAFPGNRWGWLAEAQGRFYMTFERKPSEKTRLPALGDLEPEAPVTFSDGHVMTVAEVGRAESAAAEGEIPYRFVPGVPHEYADLYGAEGAFATLSSGTDGPTVYMGREVTLDELGLADARSPERASRQISALHVACPQCGGPLTLVAPDKTERVACPSCQSLLDCRQGNLTYLKTLGRSEHHPLIPLGTVGTFRGTEYTVIGFLARSVTFDDVDYFWTEYLLYHPREGFRWLVHSDKHWSFVRPISAGAVSKAAGTVSFEGRTFRLFQVAQATVRHVLGEFYWKVTVGETVSANDYIAPPEILSIEVSRGPDDDSHTSERQQRPSAREVSCSLGTYVTHAEIEQAFHVEDLPRGFKVAPNQPSPIDKRIFALWGVFGLLLAFLDGALSMGLASQGIDQGMFFVALLLISIVPIGVLLYGRSFEQSRWADSEFNPYDTGGDDD